MQPVDVTEPAFFEGHPAQPLDDRFTLSPASGFRFAGRDEVLFCIQANRFEQPVTEPVTFVEHIDQRLRHERTEKRDRIAIPHDLLRGFERETSRKDRQPTQRLLFVGRQHLVAPIQRRSQGVLSLHAAPSADQQAESIVEPLEDLLDGELGHLRRRQLDGQWDAVEPPADLCDHVAVLVGHHEALPHECGPIREETKRL